MLAGDVRRGVPAIFRKPVRWAAFLGAAMLVAAPAAAQGEAGAWQFEVTPYMWASGIKGDTQAGALPKTSVDASFSDILDILDFGLMGAFEARKGRWGFLMDALYMELSVDGTASRTGPGPVGATLTASAEVEMKQTMLAVAAYYRWVEGSSPVDLVGGLRYNKLEVSADINASLFGQTGTASRSGSKDWVDPYVGVRVQHPITERWSLVGYADVGGFGVGSDLAWQALAGANYAFTKSVTGNIGYRYLSVDYDQDDFLYDMVSEGAYIGVGIRF